MLEPKVEIPESPHFPCICTEVAKWEKTNDSKSNNYDDVELATCLFRCQAKSSGGLQIKPVNRAGKEGITVNDVNFNGYFALLFQPLSTSFNYLRYTWDMWRAPSATLVAYARLHGRGSPWKIGYLISNTPNFSEVYVVSEGWMESIRLPCLTNPTLATGQHPENSEIDVLQELVTHLSVTPRLNEDEYKLGTESPNHQPFRRWQLKYIDPWPSWRYLTFNSRKYSETDNDRNSHAHMRLAAIAYSNGSVEVINLSSTTKENGSPVSNSLRRSQILIPAPYDNKTNDPRLKLFPVVFATFFGNEHLLVCHFRGHVDLWHLDWSAKRFPARLMCRITPTPVSRGSFCNPILAADFDLPSRTLVLAGLPKTSGALHERLSLAVYQVSKTAPFLRFKGLSDDVQSSLVTVFVNQLNYGKVLIAHLLNRLFHTPTFSQSDDAVAFLQINSNVSDGPVVGVLQASGTCSIWSLPKLEPLCIVIGTDVPPSVDPNIPAELTQPQKICNPFRLTWWNSQSNNRDTVQLAVLRDDGTLNVLKYSDLKTTWLTLPSHQLRELGLHEFATFAYADVAGPEDLLQTRELLVIDFSLDNEIVSNESVQLNEVQKGKSVIRAIQLASTTVDGLFGHFIHTGRYEEAIKLAEQQNLDVELVYQQQWLQLAIQVPYLADFDNLITTTLNRITHRPLWVILQCLLYLPPVTTSSLISSEQFFRAMRSLLNHGLHRIRSLKQSQTISVPEATRDSVERRLLELLGHIDTVQALLPYEGDQTSIQGQHSTVYDIGSLVSTLRSFRQHAVLDIAVEYAHTGCFRIVQQLILRYPRSVGRYRLAIASSLSETVHPSLYVDCLLTADFSKLQESPYSTRDELESLAVERLEKLWSEFSKPLEDHISPVVYAKRLAQWLIERTHALDARTGLTNYALALVESGGNICSRICCDLMETDRELSGMLFKLQRLRWNLAFLSEIVYRKPDHTDYSTNPTRVTATIHSKSKPVVLARFRLREFESLAMEDRLGMLIQVHFSKQSNRTATSNSVVAMWALLTALLIHYCGSSFSKRFSELMTYCLWRMVNLQGLKILLHVLAYQTGEINTTVRASGDFDQHWWSNTVNSTSIPAVPFLKCIVQVIRKYEPTLSDQKSSEEFRSGSEQLVQIIKRVNAYKDSLKKLCFSGDRASLDEISCEICAVERCATGLVEFCDFCRVLEARLGSPVKIGISSIGQLIDASRDGKAFRHLLAHWMAVIAKLSLHKDIKLDRTPPIIALAVSLDELTEIVLRLRDILKRLFANCPAQQWVPFGLRFSLLSAGNERLLAVSKALHSTDDIDSQFTSDSPQWLACLLLAVRTYVDASVPSPNDSSRPASKQLHMDPNERLARQCIELFRELPGASSSVWREQFDREERFLEVASYLAEIRNFVDTSANPGDLIVAPRQLRPLWVDSSDPTRSDRRYTVFQSAIEALLGARASGKRSKLLQVWLEPEQSKLSQLFDLTPVQTLIYLLETLQKYTERTWRSQQHDWHVDDWMPRALELLTVALESGNPSYWLVCAQWAGYTVEAHPGANTVLTDSNDLSLIDACWTPLHALFHIGPEILSNNQKNVECVERFRVRLARFAIGYCPVKYANSMSRLLTAAMHRLARAQSINGIHKRDSLSSRIQHVSSSLGHLIREHWSPSRPSDSKSTMVDTVLQLQMPIFYLPLTSSDAEKVTEWISRDKPHIHGEQLASWIMYLESWLGKAPGDLRLLNFSCIANAIEDTRLSVAFALFHSHLARLTKSSKHLVRFYEELKLLSPRQSEKFCESLYIERQLFADRFQFYLALCAFPCGNPCDQFHSPAACFPSIKRKLHKLATSSNPLFHRWCCEAEFRFLAHRLRTILPHVDWALFDTDPDYRSDIVLSACRYRLLFGLRLALFCRVPLEECLHTRLVALFVDKQLEHETEQSEARSILSWVDQFPGGLDRFICRMETTIYPWLLGLFSPGFLFDTIPASHSSTLVASLTVQTHREVLSALRTDHGCHELFTTLSYAKFIAMLLQTQIDASENDAITSFREHSLFPYVQSDSIVDVLKKILSILNSSSEICSTALTPEDLVAMRSLHMLDKMSSSGPSLDLRSNVNSILLAIGSEDSLAFNRVDRWINDVLFSEQSENLSVDQRRTVLDAVASFLKKRQIGQSENEWNKILQRILKYQKQLDRVTNQLNCIPFPPHPKDGKTSGNDQSSSGFYTQFLLVCPDKPDALLELIRELMNGVCDDHSKCADHPESHPSRRCMMEKLRWFTDHLPGCLRALELKTEVITQILVEAFASLVPSSPSTLQIALSKFSDPSHLHQMTTPVDFSPFYTRFVKDAIQGVTETAISSQLRLFGCMLANERIRRLQGSGLVQAVKDTYMSTGDRDLTSLKLLFHGALLAASEYAMPHPAIREFVTSLDQSLAWNEEASIYRDLIRLLEGSSEIVIRPTDSASSEDGYKLLGFVQTVIELSSLLLQSAKKSDQNVTNEDQVRTWQLWLEYGIRCDVLSTQEGSRNWLLDQWTKYGCYPPRGLVTAGLNYLQTIPPQIDNCTLFPHSMIISACLCQPDRELVEQALLQFSTLQFSHIHMTVDLEACVYLVCVHGSLWPQLLPPQESDKSRSLTCPALFARIMYSIEHHLSNIRTVDRRLPLLQHTLRLLRDAHLWIEAAKLSRLGTTTTAPSSFSALVGLIRHLTN